MGLGVHVLSMVAWCVRRHGVSGGMVCQVSVGLIIIIHAHCAVSFGGVSCANIKVTYCCGVLVVTLCVHESVHMVGVCWNKGGHLKVC